MSAKEGAGGERERDSGRGGKRHLRTARALADKLDKGEVTREELAARPSKGLYYLGLSPHPETGLWLGEVPLPEPVAEEEPAKEEAEEEPYPWHTPYPWHKRPREEEEPEEPSGAASSSAAPSGRRVPPQPPPPPARPAASASAPVPSRPTPAPPTPPKHKPEPPPRRSGTAPRGSVSLAFCDAPAAARPKPPATPPPTAAVSARDEVSSSDIADSVVTFLEGRVCTVNRNRVAIDYHGVLDTNRDDEDLPDNTPSASVIAACQQLKARSFTLWICSYIGEHGPVSAARREDCRIFVRNLAEALHLQADVDRVKPQGLFLEIVNSRLYDPRRGKAGKAECLRRHSTNVLIDDRAAICREAESAGILPYHVAVPGTRPRDQYEVAVRGFYDSFVHPTVPSFEAAVEQLIFDDVNLQPRVDGGLASIFDHKLARVVAARTW